MIDITLTIDDRTKEAFCSQTGYESLLEDNTPNPETKEEYVARKLAEYVKKVAVSYEASTVAQDKAAQSETEIVVTQKVAPTPTK